MNTTKSWPNSDAQVVKFMPYVNKPDLGIYVDTVFPTMPADIIDIIKLITPDPEAWFVGQFMAYLLRPTDEFAQELEITKTNILPYAGSE